MAKKEKAPNKAAPKGKAKKTKKARAPKIRVEMPPIFPVLIVILILVGLFDFILGMYIWLNWNSDKKDENEDDLAHPGSAQVMQDDGYLARRTALEERMI